jgi:predicted rRNA methylase YqxC with S4 and FtsJ domains
VAEAVGQLRRELWRPRAELVALVKPTYELHAASLAAGPVEVARATEQARRGLEAAGWGITASSESPVKGSRDAVEVFLLARRR